MNRQFPKKAQVSYFVILGVVVLIIVGIAAYVLTILNAPKTIETIPSYLEPIRSAYQQCLYTTAKDGFIIAGTQGGYIYPENSGVIALKDRETSASGIYFSPGSNITIPYWYYMSTANSCTDCQFTTKRPPLKKTPQSPSIESQVETYIADHIENCFDPESFVQRGFMITSSEKPTISVSINERDVSLSMNYPITVKSKDGSATLTTYQALLDLGIKQTYDVATAIAQDWEINDYKALDKTSMNIVYGHSVGTFPPELPPVTGPMLTTFQAPKYWLTSEVNQKLKTIFTQSIPLVQVEQSKEFNLYYPTDKNPFSESFYNNMVIPLSTAPSDALKKTKVNFAYFPWWELYLKVHPDRGGIIMPDMMVTLFPFPIATQTYTFNYDFSYPVLVTLQDDDAFQGEGYTFQYALEVNIRNNNPLTSKIPFNLSQINLERESLFGNENQKVAALQVNTINALTLEPINNVLLTYACGEDTIYLGYTELSEEIATLSTKIPQCMGGLLTATMNGYVVDPIPLSLKENQSAKKTLELYPLISKKLVIEKRMVEKEQVLSAGPLPLYGWVYKPNTSQDMEIDEQAILIFERKSEMGDGYTKIVTFFGNESQNQMVELTPGTYTLQGILIRHFGEGRTKKELYIPPKEICNPSGLLGLSETCKTIDAITFNSSFYVGGTTLDESTQGLFNITRSNLLNQTIVVPLIAMNLNDLTDIEDLEQLDSFPSYGTTYPASVTPYFTNE